MNVRRIAITGGRVIDPAGGIDARQTVYIADRTIAAIGQAPDGFQADRKLHVPGQIVCPGLIDLCARLREPGHEYKATIASETFAASRAGITTLCSPPDTSPVVDTPAVAELLKERAELVGKARVLPIGALTQGLKGTELSEMSALKDAGCVAVSNALAAVVNTLVLRRAMEYAASHDLLLIIRPDDPWLRDNGVAHEGAVAMLLGLPGIPETAETVAVAQALALIEQTGVRAHFSQLSSARAVGMIALAQQAGIPVTADVSAHQVHLTEQSLMEFDPLYHLIPPLRTEQDREHLRRGLVDEIITAVCSDHQPHEEGAKLDAFSSTEPGIASLETLLPLTLRLVDEGILTLPQAIARLTSGPARILNLESGTLALGAPADVCIFEPDRAWTVDADTWCSRGLNTPFWGQTMKGRVTHTLLAGEIVFEAPTTEQAE
jgi:dihydroorotase